MKIKPFLEPSRSWVGWAGRMSVHAVLNGFIIPEFSESTNI